MRAYVCTDSVVLADRQGIQKRSITSGGVILIYWSSSHRRNNEFGEIKNFSWRTAENKDENNNKNTNRNNGHLKAANGGERKETRTDMYQN